MQVATPTAAEGVLIKRVGAGILALTIALYVAAMAYCTLNGRIWIDEASYVVKSLKYVTGALHPYAAEDATWYMPFYFYQLGWAQQIFGQGHMAGRVMSAVLGAASGGLVFLICRRLALAAPIAALAVAHRGEIVYETTGVVEGEIAAAPSGAGGFGYDPIFYYPPYDRTLADVSEAEKLRVAHRGVAFRALAAWLKTAAAS